MAFCSSSDFKLKLTLLSDACPGSGQAYGGLVDIDVNFDKFGLPYIPGKRIKGLFKERARDLKDVGLLENEVIDIFGEKTGQFNISNGYIKDYR